MAIKLADVQNMHIGHQETTEEPLAVAGFVTNSHPNTAHVKLLYLCEESEFLHWNVRRSGTIFSLNSDI